MRAATKVVVLAVGALAIGAPIPGQQALATEEADDQAVLAFQERATVAGAIGFYRDPATAELVTLVPNSRRDSFRLADLAAPGRSRVKYSPVEQHDLDAAIAKLGEARARSPNGKEMLHYFDARTERIWVETSIPEEELALLLGTSWKLVDYHLGGFVPSGRFNDISPFWGGAAINPVGWGLPDWDCTSAFTAINGSGEKRLVTVGHCGQEQMQFETPQGILLGTSQDKYCQESNADVMTISGQNYSNWIYVGATPSGTGAKVNQPGGTPSIGSHYNASGAASYEKTWQLILSLSGSAVSDICEQDGSLSGLIVFTRENAGGPNDDLCQFTNGDSGGPLYFKNTNTTPPTVAIRGMYIGHNVGGNVCFALKLSKIQAVTGFSAYYGQ